MTTPKLFLLSMALTTSTLLTSIYIYSPSRRLVSTQLKYVTGELFVTSQLKLENILYLRRQSINTIVDMRPDGEEIDQPASGEIKHAADEAGIDFFYIPVPHGPIPAEAVHELNDALSHGARPGRVVLYCRTGNRAVRTFALVEASNPNGPDVDAILAQVHKAGSSADDLRDEITRRIAERSHLPTDHP